MTATEVLQLVSDILVITAALFLIVASIVVVRLIRRLEAHINRIERAMGVVKQVSELAIECLPAPWAGVYRGVQIAFGFLARRARGRPK